MDAKEVIARGSLPAEACQISGESFAEAALQVAADVRPTALASVRNQEPTDGHWLDFVEAFCAAHGLSERQTQIFQQVARGRMNTTIARELGVSPQTVRFHIKLVYRKLQASDRVDLLLALFEYCWARRREDDQPTLRGR